MNKHEGNRFSMLQRMLCMLFALTLALGILPEFAMAAEKQYGRINHDEVRFRRKVESTEVWAMLDKDWVVEIRSEKRSGGVSYYYVVTNIPKHTDREYYGYISQEFVTKMTAEEVSAWEKSGGNAALVGAPTATPAPATAVTATPAPATLTNYAQPTNSSTNYYSYNGTALSSLGLLDVGSSYYVSGTATIGDTAYYIITVGDTSCYVRASNMVMLTSGGSTSTVTQAPASTVTHVPATNAIGTVRMKLAGNTNMRSSAAMLSGNVVAKLKQNTEVPYYYTVESAKKTWYYCYDAASGNFGYILGSCVTVVSSTAPTVTNTAAPATMVTPTPIPGASGSAIGTVRITPKGKTNIRQKTQVNSNNVVAQAEQGELLPYYAVSVVNKTSWYYVYYAPKQVFGYVLGTCCEVVNGSADPGSLLAPTAQVVVTATPGPNSTTILGYIKFTSGGVNLRKEASINAAVLDRFDKGIIMPYYGSVSKNGVTWYYVRTSEAVGYVHGDFCQTVDAQGNVVNSTSPSGTVTQGYLMTTADKVYVRKKANGTASTYGQVKAKGTVLPIVGATVTNGGVNWYCVQFEDNIGYIHGKYVQTMNADQVNAYLNGLPMPTATPTPTPAPHNVDFIQVVKDKVWIRKSPSTNASTKAQANLNAVLPYTGKVTSGGVQWYKVTYDGGTYYIMAKYCKIMTNVEYDAYIAAQPTPVVTATPKPEDLSTTAVTNIEKVIVRGSAASNGKQLALLYKVNTVVSLLSTTPVSGSGSQWYHVNASGTTGYIRSDLLRVLTKSEAQAYQQTGDPSAKPEATYSTLQLGSTGEAVTKLQNRLVELGYLNSSNVTGTYTTATRDAVKKYQVANGLTEDGIAGSLTQHSLYGTVEAGYYSHGSSTTVQLYAPELIDWYTGGIQNIFYKGCVATVTDVKTGISFKVKRWSGGDHADVEPLTAADTAAMCKIYGVKIAQDIADKDMWQRRSLLVTIGTHSYCASMYGEPHNYPAGDTIADNDFYGQFCIHFVNSKLHGGTNGKNKKVDSDHQKAIMYAYNNAVSVLSKLGYSFK